jgi:hypothetical protein
VYTTANLGVNNLTITVKDYSTNASTCVSQVTVIPFNNIQDFQQNDTGNKGVFDFAVYPNPTSGETNVAFELPVEQEFEIRVFDLAGRLIYNSLNVGAPGVNIQSLRLNGIAAGVYILDFQSDDLKAQKRLIIQE